MFILICLGKDSMYLVKLSGVDRQNLFQLNVLFFKVVIGSLGSAVDSCFVKQGLHLVLQHSILRLYSLHYLHCIRSHLVNSQTFLYFPDALQQISFSLRNLILEFLVVLLCD